MIKAQDCLSFLDFQFLEVISNPKLQSEFTDAVHFERTAKIRYLQASDEVEMNRKTKKKELEAESVRAEAFISSDGIPRIFRDIVVCGRISFEFTPGDIEKERPADRADLTDKS